MPKDGSLARTNMSTDLSGHSCDGILKTCLDLLGEVLIQSFCILSSVTQISNTHMDGTSACAASYAGFPKVCLEHMMSTQEGGKNTCVIELVVGKGSHCSLPPQQQPHALTFLPHGPQLRPFSTRAQTPMIEKGHGSLLDLNDLLLGLIRIFFLDPQVCP